MSPTASLSYLDLGICGAGCSSRHIGLARSRVRNGNRNVARRGQSWLYCSPNSRKRGIISPILSASNMASVEGREACFETTRMPRFEFIAEPHKQNRSGRYLLVQKLVDL